MRQGSPAGWETNVERLLTTEEVAELARTSPSTVAHWRSHGTGPRGGRFGRRILYPESAVREWIAQRTAADSTPTGDAA